MKQITIEVPDGKNAVWKEINGEQVLSLVDVDKIPVTERIKTFGDAYNELSKLAINGDGFANELVEDFDSLGFDILDSNGRDIVAFTKLKIITYALNEGWTPSYDIGEYRYYPWRFIYKKDKLTSIDEKGMQNIATGTVNGNGVYGTVGGIYTSDEMLNSGLVNSLTFKSEDLAVYAGKQFSELYIQFMF